MSKRFNSRTLFFLQRRGAFAARIAPLALFSFVLVACGNEEPASLKRETVSAPVETVQPTTLSALRTVTGTIRSSNVSPLAAKVMGNVTRVHVAEGDRVKAGQLLIEIDSREGQAQTGAATSAIAAAEANANLAETTFRRFEALHARGSVSAQEFDNVKAQRDAAQAELARAKAMSAQAQTFLDYASVRSPIDGVVTQRLVDPGAQAAPGMPLLTIEDPRSYRVEALIPEDVAARIGDTVKLDWDGQSLNAAITRVQPNVDPSTRSSVVQIALPPMASSRSGQYVRVSFPTGTRSAIVIPDSAVVRYGSMTSVFVLDDENVAHMRLITLGERNEVLSGLTAGERVVTEAKNVKDGVKVQP